MSQPSNSGPTANALVSFVAGNSGSVTSSITNSIVSPALQAQLQPPPIDAGSFASPKTVMLSDGTIQTGFQADVNQAQAKINFNTDLGNNLAATQILAYSAPLSLVAGDLGSLGGLLFRATLGVANGWSTAQLVGATYDGAGASADAATSMIPLPGGPLLAPFAQAATSDAVGQTINVLSGEKTNFSLKQLFVNGAGSGVPHVDYQTPSKKP
jgi:hypothetical protein